MKKYYEPELRIEQFDDECITAAASGVEYVEGLDDVTDKMMINYNDMISNIKFVM